MARRIVHQLVDDLDGNVLELGEGETILFSLDGSAYEIDLNEQNAKELRDKLTPYMKAARSVSTASRGGSKSRSNNSSRRRSGQQDYGPIRAWAKENGHTVSERGRIPAAIIDAYNAAQ